MTYKELQSALKNLRAQGIQVNVKLNAKKDILQAEYDRIMNAREDEREPEQQAPASEPDAAHDELEQLRQELAEAKRVIAQQQQTIADLEDTIQRMQEEQEPEKTEEQENQERREAWESYYEGSDEPEERKQATYDNIEVITTVRRYVSNGDYKAAAKYMKSMMPKFHPDTCKNYGREYNQAQWLDFMTLFELVKSEDICF